MRTFLLRASAAIAALTSLLPLAGQGQTTTSSRKALVYCPVTIDSIGCANITATLGGLYTGGVDRGYDGSHGTIDLKTANLWQYEVFLVPSLADNVDAQPYALLRDAVVAERLHDAVMGRVAMWSGTPDLGGASSPNRSQKNALITNLAAWAGGNYVAVKGPGLVTFLDQSAATAARYDWVRTITGLNVGSDAELQSYASVNALTATASLILTSGSAPLAYVNMATFGFELPSGAPGVSLDAIGQTGTSVGGQVVLVTSPGGNTQGATVATNQNDYAPGTTVVITGAGWQPGETVSLSLHEDPLVDPDRSFTTVADANGTIRYTGFAPEPHHVGVRFILTATGQGSGQRAQTTFTDAGESAGIAVINGHPNDWEIFVSDRIVPLLQSGAPAVFIYTTSAVDAVSLEFGKVKEAGTRAAVDLAVPGGTWSCGPQTIGTHSIQRCAKGNIAHYYLRLLPESGLENLRDLGQAQTAIDGSTTYASWPDLYTTIGAIVDREIAGQSVAPTVFSFEVDRSVAQIDNPDHTAATDALKAASASRTWNLVWFLGNDSQLKLANVFDSELLLKQNTYAAYDQSVHENNGAIQEMIARTYVRLDQSAPGAQPPGLPVNLRAEAVSASQINLQWADNSPDETGFAIERGVSEALNDLVEIARVGTDVTTYSDVGLSAGIRYRYRVRSFNGAGMSPYSNIVGATTPQSCAAPVISTQPVSATAAIGQSASFSVSASASGALTYQWRRNGADITGATSTTYSVAGATTADAGDYVVVVTNVCGTSVTSSIATLTVRADISRIAVVVGHPSDWEIFASDRIMPVLQSGAPAVFIYTTSAVDAVSLAFGKVKEAGTRAAVDLAVPGGTWSCGPQMIGTHSIERCAKGNIAHYYLRLLPESGLENLRDLGQAQTAIDGSAMYTSWPDLYTTIGAIIDRETGAYSGITTVHSSEIDRSLAVTDNLDHTAAGDALKAASASRTWNLVWHLGNDSRFNPVNLSEAALQLKKDTYAAYDAQVHENDDFNQSILSRTYFRLDQSGPGAQPPGLPVNLRAEAVSSSQVNLQWADNSPDETGFAIERGVSEALNDLVEIGRVGANVTRYSDVGLSAGIRYRYRVRSFNGAGMSPYSNIVGATTATQSCTAPSISPQPLSATAAIGQSASFSVGAAGDGPLTYAWRRNGVAIPGATNGTYQIGVVSAADAGTYDVVVSNTCGSVTSTAATLTVGKASAVVAITSDTPDASTYGQPVAIQFTVTGVTGGPAPSGSVTVTDGSVSCTAAISAGSCSLNPLIAGTRTLVATYEGDDSYNSATSAAEPHQVNRALLTVTANDATRAYGATNPEFSGTISGVQNGDVISVTYATQATSASSVGAFAITPSVVAAPASLLANYDVSARDGTLTITQASASLVLSALSHVYDGTAKAATATPSPVDAGAAVSYSRDGQSVAAEDIKNAGSYAVSGTLTNTNYQLVDATGAILSSVSGTLVIGSAQPVFSNLSSPTTTYGTSTVSLTGRLRAGSLVPLGNVTITLGAGGMALTQQTTIQTDGSFSSTFSIASLAASSTPYPIAYSFSGAGNFASATDNSTTLTITPASNAVVSAVGGTYSYDGSPHGGSGSAVGASGESLGAVSLSYSGTGSTIYGPTASAPSRAGTYTVTAQFAGNGNYTASSSTPVALTIVPKPLTPTIAASDKVYDGTRTASATVSAVGTVGADVVTISHDAATFVDKNAGTSKTVTVTGLALGGGDAGNYTLLSATAATTATISARMIVVTATGVSKAYDGTASATVTLSDDRLTGDVLGAAYTIASFADKNVGSGKPIAVSGISISGADAGNYLANATATATADITPRALAVHAVGVDKPYDGTTVATVTLTDDRMSGDVLTTSYARASFADRNVGTNKAITVEGISVSGAAAGNYTVSTTSNATASITAKVLTGNISAQGKTYDGTTSAVISAQPLSGVVLSDVVTLGVANGRFASKAVGTRVVTADLSLSGAAAGNYVLSAPTATASATIAPKALTGAFSAASKVYDGTTTATVASRSLPGVIDLDAASLTVTTPQFDTKAVGTGKQVSATLSLSGADAGNYTVNATATTTADITARALAVTAAAQDKVYDGTTSATVAFTDDRIAGDALSFSYSSAAFATKAVGTSKPVTVTGIVLGGADRTNYTANITATAVANITTRSLLVSATGASKTYDGTTSATVTLADDRVPGDVLTAGYVSASFASAAVGTNKTITVSGITIAGVDAGNYSANTTANASASIIGKLVTGSITASDKVYDGTRDAVVANQLLSGTVGGDAVSLNVSSALFDSKLAGDRTVTATLQLSGTAAGNYQLASQSATASAKIMRKTVTGSFTANSKTYDGTTASTVASTSLAGVVSPDVVTLQVANAQFDTKSVGAVKAVSAQLALGGADAGNYVVNATAAASAAITPRLISVTAAGQNKVYDGTTAATVTLSDNHLPGDAVSASYASAAFADANVGANKPIAVSGISLTGNDAGNYSANTAASTTANITSKAVTGNFTAASKIYDGTRSATVATRSLAGAAGSDVVLVVADALFDTKSAGTGKTVSANLSLSGTGATNYTLTSPTASATASVSPRALTVSASGVDKTYDGGRSATVSLSDDRIAGDVITASFASALFADKNAGASKTIAVTGIVIAGADASNYAANATAAASANVQTRKLTVAATGVNKVYDGTTNATVTLADDRVYGDVLTAAYASAAFADASPGTHKPITVNGISVTGNDAGNYTANATAIAAADITPVAATITLGSLSQTYDGGAKAVTTTTDPSGVPLSITYTQNGSTVAGPTGAGSYAVTATVSDPGYSAPPATGTLTIAKKLLTVTPNAKTKTYGDALPTLDGVITGFVSGENASVLVAQPTYSTIATALSPVGSYDIQAAGGAAANYDFTYGRAALTITPRAATVTVANASRVEGQANPSFTATMQGLIGSDALSCTLETTATAASSIGQYPITATCAVYPSYTVTVVPGTLTITPKLTPTITWNPADVTNPSPLTATAQLNAVVTDANGQPMTGTLTYSTNGTPVVVGTILQPGLNTPLTVTFTPNAADGVTYTTATKTVTTFNVLNKIDITPNVSANYVYLSSGAAEITLAIMGTPTFDARTVLVSSLTPTLGNGTDPGAPLATNTNGTFKTTVIDINGDGRTDLVCTFNKALVINRAKVTTSTTRLWLLGELTNGRKIMGTDNVIVRP